MNAILVMTLALSLAAADIGIGYNYRVPHTSYGVPSYQFAGSSGNTNTGHYAGNSAHYSHDVDQSGQSGYKANQGFGQQSTAYQTTYKPSKDVGGQYQTGALNTGFNNGANLAQPSYQFSGNAAQGGYQGFKQYQSQYQSSAVQKYQEYYNQLQEQPAQVFKHFYVHAAPEETEAPKFRQPVALPPPPQKHYKIIFIKTPTQALPATQFVPVPQQNEEKTIVYVLVKKPEEVQDIELPKVEQKPPAKPEVFFIKYNNKDDSQAVINNIVNDYNKGEHVSFSGANAVSGGNVIGNTAQYDTPSTVSGHYTQTGVSGLYSPAQPVVSEQHTNTGTGQYTQSTGGAFGSQSTGQVTTVTQSAPGSYGSNDGGSGQALGVATSHPGSTGGFGVENTGGVTSTTNVNYDNLISTSQGVPHETYGPPKFRA